jgi:hypothetical protein
MRTDNGLLIFERERLDLRPVPAYKYARRGELLHVSIHHGGEVGPPRMDLASAAATWRSWQRYHMDDPDHGWTDIGYTFGVDGRGRLLEGRPVWALPAAVGNHNSHSIGIVFLQDGSRHGLNEDQEHTLRVLVNDGIRELDLPPFKRLIRDPRAGVGVFGHREYSGHQSNVCPGDRIMRELRQIRNAAR